MSFKQSKILGFFQPKPKPENDGLGCKNTTSNDTTRSLPDNSKPKAVIESKAADSDKERKSHARSKTRNPPRHLQARSDNVQRLPVPSSTVAQPTSSPDLPPVAAPLPPSSAATCKFPSEGESSPQRTPKRMTRASASRFSSPLVRRPSTPMADPKQSFDLGYAPSSPTRTLFAPRTGDSNTSKRTADFALLSPKKDRLKSARTSPTPVTLSKLSEGVASPSSYPSSPSMPSSPLLPVLPKPTFDRDMEIKGSDDEDSSSSDCSLPDLEMLLSHKPRQEMPPPSAKATPLNTRLRNRRSAKSPIPSNSKPLFDMKTLLEHQRRDEAIAASSTRLDDDVEEEGDAKVMSVAADPPPSPNTTRRKFISVAGVNDKEVAGKAMRAMERTEAATAVKDRWYFFKPGKLPPTDQSPPFPRDAATGPWALLAKEGTRRQHIQSRTLQCVASRHRLPDEIFTWMLLAISGEKGVLQLAYSSLVSANVEQIQEVVTPKYLRELYKHIGAADDIDGEQVQLVQENRKAYADRDWSGLRAYLEWLQAIACSLGIESIKYAVVSLLRMAADKALMDDINTRMAHQQALGLLTEAVDVAVWDDFCQHTCSSIWSAFSSNFLRLASVQQIASATCKSRDLRRRMALAFFLGDPALARQHPDDQDIVREAMHHLQGDDFRIKRKTNYVELRAQVQLFDIALDDGSFSPGDDISDPAEVFNAEVDGLAQQLRTIWSSINDSGAAYLSRTEAKNSIDCAEKRLTYSVRTNPPPKRSIFDLPEHRGEVVTEMQKDFMSKFLGALKKPRLDVVKDEERRRSALGSDDTSDAEDSFMSAVGEL